MNIARLLAVLLSTGLLFAGCSPPEKGSPKQAPRTARTAEPKKAVKVRHLAGEVLTVNAKSKTLTVRYRDRDYSLRYNDETVVKVNLESVPPAEIPIGTRATVKYVEKSGQRIAKGIFISTETVEKGEQQSQSHPRNSA